LFDQHSAPYSRGRCIRRRRIWDRGGTHRAEGGRVVLSAAGRSASTLSRPARASSAAAPRAGSYRGLGRTIGGGGAELGCSGGVSARQCHAACRARRGQRRCWAPEGGWSGGQRGWSPGQDGAWACESGAQKHFAGSPKAHEEATIEPMEALPGSGDRTKRPR
jgi:hypothetical protein